MVWWCGVVVFGVVKYGCMVYGSSEKKSGYERG